ncbi:SRPBCC family protein [Streptomyces sp. NPDC001691]|uniref:SRPBCC family protein n=1 Tax=Streptomyces sp. NPDC001691 TaxID=3364600 RepID=UPI0036B813FC
MAEEGSPGEVGVSSDTAYRAVSCPSAMGRWSPENLGTTLPVEAGSAEVGTQFVGRNKRGLVRWVTRCTVTAADPGSRFAFRVHAIGLRRPRVRGRIATWEYRFETTEDGTRITETWTDDRTAWPDLAAGVFDRAVTGGSAFATFQLRNIRTTLRNLKRELESSMG